MRVRRIVAGVSAVCGVVAVGLFAPTQTGARPGLGQIAENGSGTVMVVVTGLRNNKGRVYCKLYNAKSDFPSKKPEGVRNASGAPAGNRATCIYHGVPNGRYAVAVAHDENGNRKVDRTLIGIPKEGYGFSAGAKPTILGAPSFRKASFEVKGDTRHVIRIINP